MFARAYGIASTYTRAVISATRRWDGRLNAGVGAFVVVNADGWFVTAGHVFGDWRARAADRPQVDEANAELAAIAQEANPQIRERRSKQLARSANPDWLTHQAFWWGRDGISAVDVFVDGKADLAVGRLDPFPSDLVGGYPVLKDPSTGYMPGRSLCRLGYAFNETHLSFRPPDSFNVERSELPFFPLDGILTRFVNAGQSDDGGYPIKFVETSAPGLMGHSGGPLFDVDGRVWGIQSRTVSRPLGFRAHVKEDGRDLIENQVINLGLAVHAETLIAILRRQAVAFTLSAD